MSCIISDGVCRPLVVNRRNYSSCFCHTVMLFFSINLIKTLFSGGVTVQMIAGVTNALSPPCGSSRSCGSPVSWRPSSAGGRPSPPLCPGADGTDAVWRTGGRPSSPTGLRTPAGPTSSESEPPSAPWSDSSDAPESPPAAAHTGREPGVN